MVSHNRIKFDRDDLDRLHDVLLDVLSINVTDEQIAKLVTLCPDWDNILDTLGREQIIDTICLHFVGMKVPMYGSPDEYKKEFWQKIKDKRSDIELFLNS